MKLKTEKDNWNIDNWNGEDDIPIVSDYEQGYNEVIVDYETYHNAVLLKLADEGEIRKILFENNITGVATKDVILTLQATAVSTYIREAI